MTWDAYLAASITLGCISLLAFTRLSASAVFFGGLTTLLLAGLLDIETAVAGFANPGLLAIAALYIVAAGMRQTGAIDLIGHRIFNSARSLAEGQLRLMLPASLLSAFINNTPVVATFAPAVLDWTRKRGWPASKFLIPLSYAAILGGSCTLIGTSTNLVVNGLLLEQGKRPFGFFELAWLGLPSVLLGWVYILIASRWILPGRQESAGQLSNPREYTVEMQIDENSPLHGKTVKDAGLRNLPGLYLIEIERSGEIFPAIGPEQRLFSGDRLVFAGVTDSIADLQKIRGLRPATNQIFKLKSDRSNRMLTEAVVSGTSSLAGKTVKECRFRARMDAVVIAVARNGQRIGGKIGDIRLRAGDVLLIESDAGFAERYRNSTEFLLVKPLDGSVSYRHHKAWIAWSILGGIVLTAALGVVDILTAAFAGAVLMMASGCCSGSDARRSVDLDVLVIIACAFAFGAAMEKTGVAAGVSHGLTELSGGNPYLTLLSVYIATVILTEMITNNAAAVLMFPLAHAAAESLGLNFMPFAIAITFAASASFATPIGYQTNLMVYGPGGYRFTDYLRFGLPLNILLGITALLIIPQVWPLVPAG